MRFFRRQSSPALMALLAVAMQAALLLAHAHVHAAHPQAPASRVSAGQSGGVACRALVRPADCAPAIPHDHHDDCPLCWSLAASGAAVLPTPSVIPVPALTEPSSSVQVAGPMLVDAGSAPFQARGPPVS